MRHLILAAILTASGCVLQEVDLEGKSCPCASGWMCDEATQTCVSTLPAASGTTSTSGTETTAVSGMTTGQVDPTEAETGSSSSSGPPPSARFDVVEFAADWSTPNSIHWTWDVTGEEADFHAWTIWIATDQAALEDGEGALVFDGATNPELGRFALKNTQGVDPVVGALTRGLEPNTEYFARLIVEDTAGGQSRSANVAVRSTTGAPSEFATVFADEALPPGAYPLPACFSRSDASPHLGSHHYALTLRCGADGLQTCDTADEKIAECWENLRLQDFSLPLTNIGGGDFGDAFLEFHLSIAAQPDVEGHAWWSVAQLNTADGTFGYSPLTIPADGTYQRIQVPLSVLGMSAEDLAVPVNRFTLGSLWQNPSELRVDEVVVRW